MTIVRRIAREGNVSETTVGIDAIEKIVKNVAAEAEARVNLEIQRNEQK